MAPEGPKKKTMANLAEGGNVQYQLYEIKLNCLGDNRKLFCKNFRF